MDGLLVLLGLLVLAIPVSIIALLVGQSRLRARVAVLEALLAASSRSIPPDALRSVLPVLPIAEAEAAPAPIDAAAVAEVPPEQGDAAEATSEAASAPGPWATAARTAVPDERAAVAARKAPEDQDQPLVMRADRLGALAGWLRENWVYAVSALSLALAGVFFVQYGMEKGLLPPAARVLAALAFGAVLMLAGEWLRRRDGRGGGDEVSSTTAYIPSVFSGAGLVSIFAAVVAARQLYGLIGPGTAFTGHLVTAMLAVVLGWFYGPLLVAVGLLGAAAAPFIVDGGGQAAPWLYAYFGLIAATGLAVDAVRRWAWVSVLALVLAYVGGWLVMMGGGGVPGAIGLAVALPLLAIALPILRVVPDHDGPSLLEALAARGKSGWPSFPVRLAAGSVLASCVALFLVQGTAAEAMLGFAALAFLAVALLIWAERAPALDDLALFPAVAFVLRLAAQGLDFAPLASGFYSQRIDLRLPETSPSWIATWLLGMAVVISAAAAYRAMRDDGRHPVAFGIGAVLVAPVAAAVLELLWNPAAVLGAYLWALHLIALAAGATLLALRFARSDGGDMRRTAHATLSALSLIALALFVLTTQTALTLALAVLVVVAAGLDRRFKLPEMGLFLQIGAAVLGYRLLADPGIGWALDAPLLQVLLAFGGVIGAMLAALWLLRGLDRPSPKAVLESAAVGLGAILVNVLIARWLTPDYSNPDVYPPDFMSSHWGLSLQALPWIILMLMQLYRARLGGPMRILRLILAGVGGIVGGVTLAAAVVPFNPLLTYSRDNLEGLVRGPLVFDTLALAYAVPGLILLVAAVRLPGVPRRLAIGFAACGAALLALYAGLEIRRFWHGDWLGSGSVLQEELYTYTLALMLLGAGLLYQAIAQRSPLLRGVAMAVIAVTVAKVFLIDARSLTGLTRVLSFAGLGLSLPVLAWVNRWAGRVSAKE